LTISPTAKNPDILTPSTITRLEQTGIIQYSPWDLVLAVAWSPDGNLLAVAAGESIYLYTPDLQEQSKLDAGTWTTSLAFHPGESRLASGGRDGNIQIWDIERQELILRIAAHKKGVNAVAFNPDGSLLASAGNDAVARLWDPATGENLAQMIGGTYAVPSIVFSPDGSELAITNGELVRIRVVESGRFAHTLRSQGSNYSAAWSPDGRLLGAGNTSGDISLWDVTASQPSGTISLPVAALTGPSSMVWSLGFSPDGALLAASDNRGTIYFWDIEGNNLLSRPVSSQGITSLAFSPDGRYLATGGLDGALRLWTSR
jgi:WD40 repeat protein